MTKEEKELLLKDLCARLPCEVQGITSEGVVSPLLTRGKADWDILTSINYRIIKHEWKPYLRPMSSMTEEERMEFAKLFSKWHDDELFDYIEEGVDFSIWKHKGISPVVFDWLNSHHFDYRGLIEKGLALEAPEDIYNTKTE